MHLSEMEHLRSHPMVNFKTENVDGREFVIVSYMISVSDLWKIPNGMECRGITFDAVTGECVCRPFQKFFNLNENERVQEYAMDFSESIAYPKMDGSMITPVLLAGGRVHLKTKKSFYSDVAVRANAFATPEFLDFCGTVIRMGYTPIFEYVSPYNKIVIDYNDREVFHFLTARNIQGGEYASKPMLEYLRETFGHIECIDWSAQDYDTVQGGSLRQYHTDRSNLQGVEGWVITFRHKDTGEFDFFKLKTDWYVSLHKLMTLKFDIEAKSVFSVAKMIVNSEIDDIIAYLEPHHVAAIRHLESRVESDFAQIRDGVEALKGRALLHKNIEDFARAHNQDRYFPIVVNGLRGKDFDPVKMWVRYFKDAYDSTGFTFYELAKSYREDGDE